MKYKLPKLLIILGLVLSLAACVVKDKQVKTDDKPVDLTGEWKQVNKDSEDNYQRATIQDGQITIYWVNGADETESLYWAGTYVAMEKAEELYTWDSVNDKEKTGTALLASGDETKTFTYQNGELSYYVSVMGTTKTVKMEKKE